jgi:hypothetical protein
MGGGRQRYDRAPTHEAKTLDSIDSKGSNTQTNAKRCGND